MGTKSGIYTITNTITGKVYVGSSVNVVERKARHFRDLGRQEHPNSYLQRSFNKYGQAAFVFCVTEWCENDQLIEREQFWIDEKRTSCTLYNLSPTAGNQLGIKRSEETKRRMSEALKGRKCSEESKQKMRLAKLGTHFRLGKKASEETRRRISESKKGTKASEETRKLLSSLRKGNNHCRGHKQTPEAIANRMASCKRTREKRKQEALRSQQL